MIQFACMCAWLGGIQVSLCPLHPQAHDTGEKPLTPEPKFVPEDHVKDPHSMWTHSIVSAATARGIVVIEWNKEKGQFDPEDARRFAHAILREADNAETDAWFYTMMKNKLKVDNETMAVIITDFRADRAKREQLAGLRRVPDEIPEEDRR